VRARAHTRGCASCTKIGNACESKITCTLITTTR
jgi:hypothetical protein